MWIREKKKQEEKNAHWNERAEEKQRLVPLKSHREKGIATLKFLLRIEILIL